ncbi:MAG: hypothetical protein ACREM3_14390 [Candidatus Rokuibacteriota bacterium]
MEALISHLLERWSSASPRARSRAAGGQEPVGAPAAAESPSGESVSPLPQADLCRLCREPIEAEDTVAAGGDDVLHTRCYDRSLDG